MGERKPPAPNEARDAPNPWPPPSRFWVTRDSDPLTGVLETDVDVWTSPPHRAVCELGAFWVSPADEGWDLSTRWGRYTVASFAARVGTVPDDDRQCVRYEWTWP